MLLTLAPVLRTEAALRSHHRPRSVCSSRLRPYFVRRRRSRRITDRGRYAPHACARTSYGGGAPVASPTEVGMLLTLAPVAQLDRAPASGAGCGGSSPSGRTFIRRSWHVHLYESSRERSLII